MNTQFAEIDNAFASGARTALKDAAPGTSVQGAITRVDFRQATEYGTGMPAVFANSGQPKMQLAITIETSERDAADPNDTGERTVWIKAWGNQRKGLTQAVEAAGYKTVSEALTVGNILKVTFEGETRQSNGRNSWTEKTYRYEITRAQTAAADQAFTTQQAAPPQPQAAPVVNTPAPPQQANVDPREQATRLIGLGMSNEEIAGYTQLTPAQVQQLRAPF